MESPLSPASALLAPLLVGAVVQRADAGGRSIVLKVREPGRTTFILAVAGRGAGLLAARPPKPEGAKLLGKLEGFRVAWLRDAEIGLERGDERGRIDAARGRVEVKIGAEAWTDGERAP